MYRRKLVKYIFEDRYWIISVTFIVGNKDFSTRFEKTRRGSTRREREGGGEIRKRRRKKEGNIVLFVIRG